MHYHGDPQRLRAGWIEATLASDEQADKLQALYQGLVGDTFDIALSGQMMLPQASMGDIDIEWTAPTAILFTGITYT